MRFMYRNVQRCAVWCAEVCGGTEGCAEVHKGVCGDAWMDAQTGALRCMEVCIRAQSNH